MARMIAERIHQRLVLRWLRVQKNMTPMKPIMMVLPCKT